MYMCMCIPTCTTRNTYKGIIHDWRIGAVEVDASARMNAEAILRNIRELLGMWLCMAMRMEECVRDLVGSIRMRVG